MTKFEYALKTETSDMIFYKKKTTNSEVKIALITHFFSAYSKIISSRSEFSYFDFFAGPGIYSDGSESTPIRVMNILSKLESSKIHSVLFNELDRQNFKCLKSAIESHSFYKKIPSKILLSNDNATVFTNKNWACYKYPIFSFVDPFGYKGVSSNFIHQLTEPWGSDCILFFNYNRIYNGLNNPKIQNHIDNLFGTYSKNIRDEIVGATSNEKEKIVLKYFSENLNKKGKRYLLPIRFFHKDKKKTSHFILIVSKEILPLRIFKSISENLCNTTPDYFLSFDINKEEELMIDFTEWRKSYAKKDILEYLIKYPYNIFQYDFSSNRLPDAINFVDNFEKYYASKNNNIISNYNDNLLFLTA